MRTTFQSALCLSIIVTSGMVIPAHALDAASLLQKADVEYGAYLAGECATCHRQSTDDQNIPDLAGYDAESTIALLVAYRSKELSNEVMQLVAARLDDEQIASLAAYFGALEAQVDD